MHTIDETMLFKSLSLVSHHFLPLYLLHTLLLHNSKTRSPSCIYRTLSRPYICSCIGICTGQANFFSSSSSKVLWPGLTLTSSITEWWIGQFHCTAFVFWGCAITYFTEYLSHNIEAFAELCELIETLGDGV